MSSKRDLELVLDVVTRIASGESGVNKHPLTDDDTTGAILLSLEMLSEELDAERAKRAQTEALLADERDAYQHSPGLLCSIDVASLGILKCNRTLELAVGAAHNSLIGVPVTRLFDERQRASVERVLRAAACGEVASLPDLVLRGAQGQELHVGTSFSLTSDPSPRMRVVWTDVTNERRLEAQLLQAQKMQAIGRLSGGVAHDFNNILGIILASVTFLREDTCTSATFEQDLDLIEQATRRGAELTTQLLLFSRQQVAEPKRIQVGALLREADRMLRRLIGEAVDLSLDVPDQDLSVVADPAQLTQVVLNLVVNARDAVEARGRVRVELQSIEVGEHFPDRHPDLLPGHYALIRVSDDGPGMSSEVASQAFEPFFTTKPAGEGTGLGLSVCYGIVRQMGGHISLYSEASRGTTVNVYLPVSHVQTEATTESRDHFTRHEGHEVVLLVEDDTTLRQLTARMLQRSGYRVVAAANGADAVERMSELDAVDLVITDAIMPELGGRALVERLFQERKARAALYLSGYAAHGGGPEVLDEGVHFLAKPYTAEQLLSAVRRSIRDV